METNFSPKDRIEILKKYHLNHVSISELCEKYNVTGLQIDKWNKDLFDNGEVAFLA